MGVYRKYKEDLGEALDAIKDLENSNIPDEEKKEAYDRYHKQAQVANTRVAEYGYAEIFRFQTPKGRFYLVNIDETDIPELMEDLQIENYMYAKINSREIMKL